MKNLFLIFILFLCSCKYSNPLREFPEKVLEAFEQVNYKPPLPKSALQIISPKSPPVFQEGQKGVIPFKKKVNSLYYTTDDIYFEAEDLPEGSKFDTKKGQFIWTPKKEDLKGYKGNQRYKIFRFKIHLFTKKKPVIGISKEISFLVEKRFLTPEILTIEAIGLSKKNTYKTKQGDPDVGKFYLFEDEHLTLRVSVKDESFLEKGQGFTILHFYENAHMARTSYLREFSFASKAPTQSKKHPGIWHYLITVKWSPSLFRDGSLPENLKGMQEASDLNISKKDIYVQAVSYKGKKSKMQQLEFRLIRSPEKPSIGFFRTSLPVYKGTLNRFQIPIFTFSPLNQINVSLRGACVQDYDFFKSLEPLDQKYDMKKTAFPGVFHCSCAPLQSDYFIKRYSLRPASNISKNSADNNKNNAPSKDKKYSIRGSFALCELEVAVRDDFPVSKGNEYPTASIRINASSYYAKNRLNSNRIYEQYKTTKSVTQKKFDFYVREKEDNPSFHGLNIINEYARKENKEEDKEEDKEENKEEDKEVSKNNLTLKQKTAFSPEYFILQAQKDLKQIKLFFLSYKTDSLMRYLKSFFRKPPVYAYYRSYVHYLSFFLNSSHKVVLGENAEVLSIKKEIKSISEKLKSFLEKKSSVDKKLMEKVFYVGVLDALGSYLDFLWAHSPEKRKLYFESFVLDLSSFKEEVFSFHYSSFFKKASVKDLIYELNEDESFYEQSIRLRRLKTKYLMELKKDLSDKVFLNFSNEKDQF